MLVKSAAGPHNVNLTSEVIHLLSFSKSWKWVSACSVNVLLPCLLGLYDSKYVSKVVHWKIFTLLALSLFKKNVLKKEQI